MSNYPNMSYCMCQNTQLALDQLLNAMSEVESTGENFAAQLSAEERQAFYNLLHSCKTFAEAAEFSLVDMAQQDS